MNKDEEAALQEDQVTPDRSGMGARGGKGPTPTATSPKPGAFGDALGRKGKGGVHDMDDQTPVFDEVGPKDGTPSSEA